MSFKTISAQPDFVAMEKELLSYWQKEGIVKKYLRKNNKSKKLFRFLDGPITANNPMGVHHAWGRTYKDLFQRYKNMQGFGQRFQNGFDAQGLWVEVNVEKELGLKTKQDIENLVPGDKFRSIAKFVELCKDRVNKFARVQTDQSKRLGYFMDWEHSYITMSDENNYMIWQFLKKCHEQELIYEGLDAVPWCSRCGTAISNHEILTEGYQELTHRTVTIKYPIVGRSGEYLLVWTTTPWTLPGNVAIAVNPKLTYSRVKFGNEIYYIAQNRLMAVLGGGVEVLDEVSGEQLLDLTYKGPFDNLEAVDKARRENLRTFHKTISGGELVTEEEGTGLVHIAPGAGHEDFILGRENNLSIIHIIDGEAKFLPGFGEFSSKASSKPEPIIKFLKVNDWLVKQEEYTHRYPVCWRCSTELVFRAVSEWYIAMDPLRKTMAEVTKNITWIPEFARERELDWIKNMGDWLISKKRYWGLALPIWKCLKCSHFTVISGKEELKDRAIERWNKFSGHSPHRPWVDEVKIKCEKCNELVSRIPDVGNPWLDAGIVPFSTLPKEWFPADFITESFPGQFKGWFYSMLAMSAVLEGSKTVPFKTVLGFATLLAEDGRPMHKSWGNAIEFNEGADKIGVDTMRWLYIKQDPANNLLFGYKVADETRRSFHLPLWNIYNFFVTYANFDDWKPKKVTGNRLQVTDSNNILDIWILVRLKQVVQIVTESLEKYDPQTAALAIEKLVEDLSNWYIRRSRERVGPSSVPLSWTSAGKPKDKNNFYQTTYFLLVALCQILAPFLPFLSETIFMNLSDKISVHLEDWPALGVISKNEEDLIVEMAIVRKAAEVGHAARKTAGLKVRQPLSTATVTTNSQPNSALLPILAAELNVARIIWKKKKSVAIPQVVFNTKITDELLELGRARDLVREIQEKRKEQKLGLGDLINVYSPWRPVDKKLFEWVKKKTLATSLNTGKELMIKTSVKHA